MLRSNLFLALGTAGLLASMIACGDDTGIGAGGTGGTGGAGAGDSATPPPRPTGANPGDGPGKVFGTTKLYLGGKTRDGQADDDAWKDFGYDLDGVFTTDDFSNHCTPAAGGIPTNVFPDGNSGIDNSFGNTLLPLVSVAGDIEVQANEALAAGSFNIMVNMRDLGDDASYDPIDAILLAGKNGMGNSWELVPEFLTDPMDPDSSKVAFADSYLADNVWVSGNKGNLDLTLSIAGFELALEIKSAFITMKLNADHSSATEGVIAGVLDAEDLISQIQGLAGNINPDFCDPNNGVIQGILNQVRQSADIMADGTQQAGTPCTGISIGLGFDAEAVTVVGVGEPAEPADDPCDGGGGSGM